jgi:hypothetical protein
LNSALDAVAQQELFGNRQKLKGLNNQFTISVRNDTVGTDFERYDAIGLDDAIIDPLTHERQFLAGVNFSGVLPTADHVSRFAICLEPIKEGKFGRCLLYGVTPAKIDVTSLGHGFCQPVPGDVRLSTVDFGGARMIWPTAPTSLGEQFAYVLLTGNGQATTGERISGELFTPLSGATRPEGSREPGSAIIRVWTTDPDNKLEDQTKNRYAITGVVPTDPLDLPAVQSFEIATDVRYRLARNHPIYVVESTSRNGTYKIDDPAGSVTWDAGTGRCTINVSNDTPIASVPDPASMAVPPDELVDGTILIPGGDRRIESDRYEVVLNYSTRTGDVHAWCSAVHDGSAYQINTLDC